MGICPSVANKHRIVAVAPLDVAHKGFGAPPCDANGVVAIASVDDPVVRGLFANHDRVVAAKAVDFGVVQIVEEEAVIVLDVPVQRLEEEAVVEPRQMQGHSVG